MNNWKKYLLVLLLCAGGCSKCSGGKMEDHDDELDSQPGSVAVDYDSDSKAHDSSDAQNSDTNSASGDENHDSGMSAGGEDAAAVDQPEGDVNTDSENYDE